MKGRPLLDKAKYGTLVQSLLGLSPSFNPWMLPVLHGHICQLSACDFTSYFVQIYSDNSGYWLASIVILRWPGLVTLWAGNGHWNSLCPLDYQPDIILGQSIFIYVSCYIYWFQLLIGQLMPTWMSCIMYNNEWQYCSTELETDSRCSCSIDYWAPVLPWINTVLRKSIITLFDKHGLMDVDHHCGYICVWVPYALQLHGFIR